MVNYLLICPRKLWLYSKGIRMEHTLTHLRENALSEIFGK
ncbi:Dna2/Cas4 domain-containing protein [bacterium]|nr:Dna2/Cas4 domain-containing protein [bacterium]